MYSQINDVAGFSFSFPQMKTFAYLSVSLAALAGLFGGAAAGPRVAPSGRSSSSSSSVAAATDANATAAVDREGKCRYLVSFPC